MPEARYVPVQGTWSWTDLPNSATSKAAGAEPLWWQRGSTLDGYLRTRGIVQLDPENPFIWSSEVAGLFLLDRSLRAWKAGGWNLKQYLQHVTLADRNILAHSHGLQVAAFAAAYWREADTIGDPLFNTVITVGGPIHDGVPYHALNGECRRWLFIAEAGFDRIQFLGGLGAGDRHNEKSFLDTHVNVALVPGIQHSRILYEAQYMSVWEHEGFLDWFFIGPNA